MPHVDVYPYAWISFESRSSHFDEHPDTAVFDEDLDPALFAEDYIFELCGLKFTSLAVAVASKGGLRICIKNLQNGRHWQEVNNTLLPAKNNVRGARSRNECGYKSRGSQS